MGGAYQIGVRKGRGSGAGLRDALSQVPGLRFRDAHRGTLGSGRRQASVCIESLDCIGIRLAVSAKPPSALQCELPGNLRFARSAGGLFLIADIHTEPLGLVDSFAEVDRGLRQATGRPRKSTGQGTHRGPGLAPEAAAVQAALDALPWNDGAIVRHENGHEVRPHIGDSAVPVQVVPTSTGLHLHRPVVDSIPEGDMVEQAVGDQSQRLNARLRWARLTRTEGGITAEAHVSTALITPRILATACRAVAAAAHHSAALLDLLAHQGEVARQYFDMFINQHSPWRCFR